MCKNYQIKFHPPHPLLLNCFILFIITIPNFCLASSIPITNNSSLLSSLSTANSTISSSSSSSSESSTLLTSITTTTSSPKRIPTLLKPMLPQALTQEEKEQDMLEKCHEFIDSSSNNEFHSPGYPDDYYHNVNCVKVISAGEGEVIKLRFLDHFHIEPSENCMYDYLEIRDGQFGYSTHIVTLCGTSPPTVIESSGRHLWLRFHTDMDIHYVGFRAFYEFVPSPIGAPDLDDCSFHLTSIDGDIVISELSPDILISRKEHSLQYLDCTWHIEAPPNQRILVQFVADKFKLEKANDCTFNFVEVYGSRTEYFGTDGILKRYCGAEADAVQSKTNVLHLRFFTTLTNDNSEIGIGFRTILEMYYSFYRDLADKVPGPDGKLTDQEPCKDNEEFDCTDSTCIDTALTCNDKPNCKQNNDESKEKCIGKVTFRMGMDLVVIAFIGCFLAAGMCSGLFLNVCRKLRQDKIEMDEIRASAHKSSRDSMGNSKASSKHQSKDDLKSIQEVIDRPSKSSSKLEVEKQQHQPHPSPRPEKEQDKLRSSSIASVSSPPPNNNSPSSQENNVTPGSSSESKETVVYRPYYRNPEVLIGGGGNINTAPPPPPTQSTTPYGFVLKNQQNQQPQQQSTSSIPYSPPPPYNPLLGKYNPPQHAPSATTPKPAKKSVMVQNEEVGPEEEEEVHVIEVRDCACQTKESFTERYLKEVYFGGPRYYAPRPSSSSSIRSSPAAMMLGGPGPSSGSTPGGSTAGGSGSLKRAPLARGEAIEFIDPVHPRKHLRRVPKGAADIMMYPRGPASICSSVDASTGSLELLSELDEELIIAKENENADDIEGAVGGNGSSSNSRRASGYNELE